MVPKKRINEEIPGDTGELRDVSVIAAIIVQFIRLSGGQRLLLPKPLADTQDTRPGVDYKWIIKREGGGGGWTEHTMCLEFKLGP